MRSSSLARLFSRRPLLPQEKAEGWPSLPDDLCLNGEKVWLRWPQLSDAEAVFAYAGDDAVSAYMDWKSHRRIEESRRFLHVLEQGRVLGREAAFGIIEHASGELVGICSLVSQRDICNAEMGYALRNSFWGKGYMTEAVNLICPWAFEHLNLSEIFADVHLDNRLSQRVLEKSGFTRQSNTVVRTIKGISSPHLRYCLSRNG